MDWISLLQWPAAVLTIVGAWLVGSKQGRRRRLGFIVYIVSNIAWVGWGVPTSAWALVALQAFLFVTNVRGVLKAPTDEKE